MNPVSSNCPIIIGIDSGYGNTKTAHFCFPTAVTAHDREPIFKMNLLVYNDRYYTIGEGHKEFVAEKAVDQDHYVLMMAGVAQELKYRNLTNARVHLAAGLPLTWVSVQKDSYGSYSKAVIVAVNDYFTRMERLGADPYLETREKEDAFLQRVQETIRQALQTSTVSGLNGLVSLFQGAVSPANTPSSAPDPEYAEDLSTAMEFIDSL